MELSNRFLFPASALVLVLLASFSASSSSTYISGDIFDADEVLIGRNLLQAKTSCVVNFEFLNYTIITSQCKGPNYPPAFCCQALKTFACPYAEELNDLTNDCASTMFSYINLYGKYPPGLFASECREGKLGLACPNAPLASLNSTASPMLSNPSSLFMVTTSVLMLLLY